MIQINNVYKNYNTKKTKIEVLKNVNLKIKEGEFISILGPSGSGKSTLLNLIGGLDLPNSGSVLVDKLEITKLNDKRLANFRNRTVGFVFQFFNLLPRSSALENCILPLIYSPTPVTDKKARAQNVLKLVGLEKRFNHKPSELSGGEQQRVAIARAIVTDPKIILADEPTGNLDSKTGEEIMEIFLDLNKRGKTIIMVTHEETLAKKTHKIVKIKDGQIL